MKRKSPTVGDVITLKDASGLPRVVLDASDPDHPFCSLMGRDKAALVLEIHGSTVRICMKGDKGKTSLLIAVRDDGSAILQYDVNHYQTIARIVDPVTNRTNLSLARAEEIPTALFQGPSPIRRRAKRTR
jgi:hypothetical protein